MRVALLLAFALVLPAPASAGIFEAAEPNVSAGNEALSRGDAATALGHYEKAIGAHPDAGEAWYDKGLALHALGRHEEAAEAFTQALARRRDGSLGAKDYTNLGNALAAMDRLDDAMRSYRSALEIDPDDEVARQNLEVLLRRKQQDPQDGQEQDGADPSQQDEERQDGEDPSQQDEQRPDRDEQSQQDGQRQGGEDQSQQDEQRQGGEDQSQQDEQEQGGEEPSQQGETESEERDGQAGSDPSQQEQDGSTQQGDPQQAGEDPAQQGAHGQRDGERGEAEAAAVGEGGDTPDGEERAVPLRQSDTERILDSLRGNEKSFQLWRSQEKGRRSDAEKDW